MKVQYKRRNPARSTVKQVLTLPEWARFKVLAYEATVDDLYKMVEPEYGPRDDSEEEEDFRINVASTAMTMFRLKTGLRPHFYSQGLRKGDRKAFLISFCSSVPLPEDPQFYVKRVKPSSPETLPKIKAVGKLIGIDDLPAWTIPDQAMCVEELVSESVRAIRRGTQTDVQI